MQSHCTHCTALHSRHCIECTLTLVHLPLPVLCLPSRASTSSAAVCLKRMGEFSSSLAALKEEEAIHNGIRKMCKSYTDKADKRFVRKHANKLGEETQSSGCAVPTVGSNEGR